MFIEGPTIDEILFSLSSITLSENAFVILFMGEDLEISLENLVLALNKKQISFIGGIFPKVIFNNTISSKGIIIKVIQSETISIFFNSTESFSSQFNDFKESNFFTAYVLTNWNSSEISEHLMVLSTYLGNNINFIGGGVGRANGIESGLIISNNGVFETGTIVALSKNKISVSSIHGWQKLLGPFIVTKAEKNLIKELNWENAFDVYSRSINENLNDTIIKENFQSKSLNFPFGLYKENREYVVRDPIKMSPEGYLQCVGNTPENSLVDLLSIKVDDLEKLPKTIVSSCMIADKLFSDSLLFDCISRANHLGENFSIELDGLVREVKKLNPDVDLEGALSIGEIFSNGKNYLEFLNKSIVLAFSHFK